VAPQRPPAGRTWWLAEVRLGTSKVANRLWKEVQALGHRCVLQHCDCKFNAAIDVLKKGGRHIAGRRPLVDTLAKLHRVYLLHSFIRIVICLFAGTKEQASMIIHQFAMQISSLHNDSHDRDVIP
jgi:hypothetical protein